ncbi:MAG: FAD-dependent oxidoreductase [Halolamina sp.]
MSERVVVLGAGAGGTMAANRLDRQLAALGEVVVVDRDPVHRYQPAYYLHPFGHLDLDDHSRDVGPYLRDDVRFVEAAVTGVDPRARTVETDAGTLEYDRLVVTLGHAVAEERVPWDGEPGVYPFYRPEAARALATALERVVGDDAADGENEAETPAAEPSRRGGVATDGAGVVAESGPVPEPTPETPLRVVVTTPTSTVSCGGSPLKMALLAEDHLTGHGVPCEVTVTTPGDHVFGTGRKARYDDLVADVMDDRVEHVPNFDVADVTDGVVVGEDGRRLPYDLYAPVSPQRCPRALTDGSPLTTPVAGEPGEYVATDPETLRHRRFDRVYALGDCTDLPTSKTAAAARKQAAALTDNLTADVTDRDREVHYEGFAACPLLTEAGKAVVATYDYDGATAPAVESRLGWIADVHVLPRLYWRLWLRGYLLGV